MKTTPIALLAATLCLVVLAFILPGCSSKSDNIPTSYEDINALMQQGWADYNTGNFTAATNSFRQANQRNAFYLPAYNGLGWSAVRQTNFADAEVQFSFVTTLANPVSQADLLADTYAGLSLSSAIKRSVLELGGSTDPTVLAALAQESINRAQMVFNLKGEAYAPVDHDPGFGSHNLHLLNAQHFFYLQDYDSSEAQLSVVDTSFVDSLLSVYGQANDNVAIPDSMDVTAGDTTWWLQIPASQPPGIHHYTQIVPPDTTLNLTYKVVYDKNAIRIYPAPGVQLQAGQTFLVSYVYIANFPEYLYHLIEHIQELIST